jgi:hypothetical protein
LRRRRSAMILRTCPGSCQPSSSSSISRPAGTSQSRKSVDVILFFDI